MAIVLKNLVTTKAGIERQRWSENNILWNEFIELCLSNAWYIL